MVGEPTHSASFEFADDRSSHTLSVRQTPLASLYRGKLGVEEVILDAGLNEVLSDASDYDGEFRQPKWTRPISKLCITPLEVQRARAS